MAAVSPALARRYAEALYDVLDEPQREWTLRALRQLAWAWRQSRELRRFVAAPMVPADVRITALGEAAGTAIAHPLDDLLLMLLERGRHNLLLLLADAFERVIDERQGQRRVIVHTAVPLSSDEVPRIVELAHRIAGGPAKIELRVDPSVIGGIQLQCGDRVVDATLRGHLERLAREIAEAPLIAE
ncbi:MAG: ATP synthase F1 subunit delta [Armatimonadetes bacterium]|nr:ATP synthase F1 subunit delta [Armatimonadota bacterium]